MRIKTFEAATAAEALLLAKTEMGDEAMILNVGPAASGSTATRFQVTVGVDIEPPKGPGDADIVADAQAIVARSQRAHQQSTLRRSWQQRHAPAPTTDGEVAARSAAPDNMVSLLAEIRGSLQTLTLAQQQQSALLVLPTLRGLLDHLTMAEVAPDLLSTLLTTLAPTLTASASFDAVLAAAHEVLHHMLPSGQSALEARLTAQRRGSSHAATAPVVVVAVGMTGSGKSSVLGKMAARLARAPLALPLRVGIVSIDHARIGTTAGLRTLAGLLGLPFVLAYTPGDLAETLADWSDGADQKDVVLIDTPGYQRGEDYGDSLRAFLDTLPQPHVYAVSAATHRLGDTQRMLSTLQARLGDRGAINGIVATKLDETNSYGPLLSLSWHSHLPILYLAEGTDSLSGLTLATPSGLRDLILPPAPHTQARDHRPEGIA